MTPSWIRPTRSVSWIKAARKTFDTFPEPAKAQTFAALTIAAEGRKADITKPMRGLGAGLFEIAVRHRTDAYRVVYALQGEDDVWVVHAFRKKSKRGGRTPKQEIDLVRTRLRRLRTELRW